MKVYLRKSIAYIDIILFLIGLLPVVDAINGISIHYFSINGIGMLYHSVLTFICLLYLIGKGIKKNPYFYSFIICSVSILISVFLDFISGEAILEISVERIIKILVTLFFFYFFYEAIIHNYISWKKLFKLIFSQCFLIISISSFADLSGLCNMAYDTSGRIGFYAGTNEPTMIFTFVGVFLLFFIYNRTKIIDSILFFLCEMCIVLTESKSGLIITALFFIFYFCILTHKTFYSKKNQNIILFFLLFFAVIIGIYRVIPMMRPSFVARQNYLSSAWISQGRLAYFSSGRTSRLKTLMLDPINDCFNKNPLIGFLKIVFGFGAVGSYGDTFEMDYLDIIMYGGLIWGIVFIVLSVVVIKKIFKHCKSLILRLSVVLVFACSFAVGHIWVGGNSGIYFALLMIVLSTFNNKISTIKER